MKTITKLLLAILCVCLLSACTKEEDSLNNSSQPNTEMKSKDLNRSISDRYVWENITITVQCEGKSDTLKGNLTSHCVPHFTNGEYIRQNEQFSYTLKSIKTGELFIGKDKYKFDGITWSGGGHVNIRGNWGSHYILRYLYDPSILENYGYTFTETKCFEK